MKIIRNCILWSFRLELEDGEPLNQEEYDYYKDLSFEGCEECGYHLNTLYCEIIDNLYKAGLLPEDYKKLCCHCYFLEKIGLLDLIDYFDYYDTEENDEEEALIMQFIFPDGENLTIRVHDYEKFLLS